MWPPIRGPFPRSAPRPLHSPNIPQQLILLSRVRHRRDHVLRGLPLRPPRRGSDPLHFIPLRLRLVRRGHECPTTPPIRPLNTGQTRASHVLLHQRDSRSHTSCTLSLFFTSSICTIDQRQSGEPLPHQCLRFVKAGGLYLSVLGRRRDGRFQSVLHVVSPEGKHARKTERHLEEHYGCRKTR